MLDAQRHRGPDGNGIFTEGPVSLGHLRLSIIDLSESGAQPMHYADRYVITYNGEVYNYRELRGELEAAGYHFNSTSDTEVILAAYAEWGDHCVHRFNGMWSFAIYDRQKQSLFCSRDRFGIKPFLYLKTDKNLIFASEVKALRIMPEFDDTLNRAQLIRYLQFGWLFNGSETLFENVFALPAGHNLRVVSGTFHAYRYWNYPEGRKETGVDAEAFRKLFFDSVRLQLRSDVPVGACLSGGLDSSSIVSAMRKIEPDTKIKTFTAFYGEGGFFDERPFVSEVVAASNTEDFYTSPTETEVEAALDDILWSQDFPIGSSSPVSQYFVMKKIGASGIKVVLDGQGADEYLGGYLHFYYRYFADLLRSLSIGSFLRQITLYYRHHSKNVRNWLDTVIRSFIIATVGETLYFRLVLKYQFDDVSISPESPDQILSFLNIKEKSRWSSISASEMMNTTLPTLLHLEDRNSMRFSLESRVPFLDHHLVEHVTALPVNNIVDGEWTKKILRAAMKGVLPEKIRLRRDKRGFVTPGEMEWLNRLIDECLKSGTAHVQLDGILSSEKTRRVLEKVRRGEKKNLPLAWRLVMLIKWVKLMEKTKHGAKP